MSDARNFLITSEYPTDKIVWLYEGQTTTDQYGSFSVEIPHNMGATIFATGIWTIDDWGTTYNSSTTLHSGQSYSRYSLLASDSTQVYFNGFCEDNDGNELIGATLKFRFWGFFNEAETQNKFADATASASSNKFIKDSRLGYPKLFMEGYADATDGTKTIYHNLGFVPFVEIWYQTDNKWYQVDYVDFVSPISTWTIQNTNTILSFNGDGYTNYKYYYRIYADE